MKSKAFAVLSAVFLPVLILITGSASSQERASSSSKITVYKQNFRSLSTGLTQPFPGETGQDGWFSVLAIDPAYGEIQQNIALGRKALHEFTSSSLGGPGQTIDARLITPQNLSRYLRNHVTGQFLCPDQRTWCLHPLHRSDPTKRWPHPGFDIIEFSLSSGNGPTKETAGVNVGLGQCNGVNNNEPIPLTVGQNLTWNTWHSVTLLPDQAKDRYVSLEVAGQV